MLLLYVSMQKTFADGLRPAEFVITFLPKYDTFIRLYVDENDEFETVCNNMGRMTLFNLLLPANVLLIIVVTFV